MRMPISDQARKILFIGLPVVLIVALIVALIVIAYRAETEGVQVGSANISIKAVEQGRGSRHPLSQKALTSKPHAAKKSKTGLYGETGYGVDKAGPDTAEGPDDYRSAPSPAQIGAQGSSENSASLNAGEGNASVSVNPKVYSTNGAGFNKAKDSFAPSTLGLIEVKKMMFDRTARAPFEITEKTNVLLALSGDLAEEVFVFYVYNSMEEGRLCNDGGFKIVPNGQSTGKTINVRFEFSSRENKYLQLPIILNGEIAPKKIEALRISVDRSGKMSAQDKLYDRIPIEYGITRMTENSDIRCSIPCSRWMNKEFDNIPKDIKAFLDMARAGEPEYRMLYAATLINKIFGYQRDVLSFRLSPGMTWTKQLEGYLNKNQRVLCDCDVLAAYSFIFLRYLGIDSVVVIGYLNDDQTRLDTLTEDEHHAALMVRINEKWLLFDPSKIAPDMSSAAFDMVSEDVDIKELLSEDVLSENSSESDQKEPVLQPETRTAKTFSAGSKVYDLLGSVIFDQSSPGNDNTTINISALKKSGAMLKAGYRMHIARNWTDRVILILFSFLALSSLLAYFRRLSSAKRDVLIFTRTPVAKTIFLISKTALLFLLYKAVSTALFGNADMWMENNVLSAIGIVFYSGGILLASAAFISQAQFAGSRTSPAEQIADSKSVYALTRNPEGIGYYLVGLGAFLFCPGILTLIALFCLLSAQHLLIIGRESFMATRFKDTWSGYASRVPRYI